MKKKAFTIAEVLIVMALIGFLFTLMIPNLVQKQGSQKYIEAAQKAQTKLQDAFSATAKANKNKLPLDWENVRQSTNKSEAIIKEISKNLQIMSYCGDTYRGCFSTNGYRTLNGIQTKVISDNMEPYKMTLPLFDTYENNNSDENNEQTDEYIDEYENNNENETSANKKAKKIEYTKADPEFSSTYVSLLEGGSLVLKTNSTYCNGIIPSSDPLERPLCGVIYLDVNGPAIPNMLGVDVFGFYISGNTILPMGFLGDSNAFEYNCLRETPNKDKYNGLACSAWALKNKNMDYRKCQAGTRLEWTGSTRCDMPAK